jgi:Glu-tRNA(Gln) amidotransferase subunit E-like FAD-binding protein
MMAVKDVSKLLADVPRGAWVALSKDEERVIAYAAELQEVLRKAKEAGENDPIVTRVPEADGTTLFL